MRLIRLCTDCEICTRVQSPHPLPNCSSERLCYMYSVITHNLMILICKMKSFRNAFCYNIQKLYIGKSLHIVPWFHKFIILSRIKQYNILFSKIIFFLIYSYISNYIKEDQQSNQSCLYVYFYLNCRYTIFLHSLP